MWGRIDQDEAGILTKHEMFTRILREEMASLQGALVLTQVNGNTSRRCRAEQIKLGHSMCFIE